MKLKTLALAALVLPASAWAADDQPASSGAVTLAPDKAYVLVRTFERKIGIFGVKLRPVPTLFRVLNDKEMAEAKELSKSSPSDWQDKIESNVVAPQMVQPYWEINDELITLTSLKPGTYVIGAFWNASLCMGTVRFEAKPGVVTDLGAMLSADDDKPTDIPELSKVVSGKDMGFGDSPQAVALRLPASGMDLPDALKSLPIVAADYRAVDAFPNFIGARISRLAPVPGVLDYDKDGHAVDLKAGAKN